MDALDRKASSIETKVSPIDFETPRTSPNESKLHCVTLELVVVVHLISRSFKFKFKHKRFYCLSKNTVTEAFSVLAL